MERFSYNHCLHILRKAGAKQARSEAAEELRNTIEGMALEISKRAVQSAYDRDRWKVNRNDVKNAVKEFLESAS